MITRITSRSNEKIKEIMELKTASTRNERKEFLVEGFHLLEMALAKKCVKTIIALTPVKDADESIDQYIVTNDIIEKIATSKTPQGVVAVCRMSEDENLNLGDKVLYLDGIQDPGNLGTIIRTALGFSFKDIILSEQCCSIYNDKALSASQGGIFYVNFIHGSYSTLELLKEDGYQIVVTTLGKSVSLNEYKPQKKQVIVLGNEAHGVSAEIQELANVRVRINIGHIDSLNVGVAAGIMMNDAIERTDE